MELEHTINKEQLEKAKNAIKKNWTPFVAGAIFAGFTYGIMRGRNVGLLRGSTSIVRYAALEIRPLSFFSKQTVVVVVREGRGHPGYLTKCLETGQTFLTQGDAARYAGSNATSMSRHMFGDLPHVNGFHFERIAGKI